MVDPVTAVALASSIVQFVDFSSKLLSKSHQIHRSATGTLVEHQHLETTTTDLLQLQSKLQLSLRPESATGELTNDERALDSLSRSCVGLGNELLEKLQKLKISGNRKQWKSFRQAFKSIWSKKAVDGLSWRLKGLREEMDTRMIVHLREEFGATSTYQKTRLDMISGHSQDILRTLSDNRDSLVENLRSQTERLSHLHQKTISTVADENARTRREILDLVEGKQKTLVRKRAAIEAKILEGLRFELMSKRHEDIDPAHKETFEWIYHDIESPNRAWNNFCRWLQCRGDIYWITGKAGSGKSTLMKYIYSNPQTKRLLLEWSGKERLVTAGFFFWNSGDELQRSLNGLLRSLFYEILEQCQELIPLAFPDRFENLDSLFELTDFRAAVDRWTLQDLVVALHRVLTQDLFPAKYFFLVDGLDEFSGDHAEIAMTLKSWTQSESVKLCLSSRPLIAFENAFEECPRLMLQHLTYRDIILYVRTKLEQDRRFLQLQCEEPLLAPVLIKEIVDKASGVFLWVKLVVASLLNGLENGDGIRDLQERLRVLPEDLKVELSYAEESDEFFLRRDLKLLDSAVIKARYGRMDRRLKSRSMGLLEIQGATDFELTRTMTGCDAVPLAKSEDSDLPRRLLKSRVEFLHKTVRDFLASPDILSTLDNYRDASWSPQMCLFRLGLLKLKIWPNCEELNFNKVVQSCLRWAHMLDVSGPPLSSGLKNELDYLLCAHLNLDQSESVELRSHTIGRSDVISHITVKQLVNPSFISSLTGWPSLLFACGIYSSLDDKPRGDPRFLEFLLLHGANPNERFEGTTVWAFILSVFVSKASSVDNEEHLKQIELLIRYGADPEACCLPWSFGWVKGRTALDVIMFSPKKERDKLQTLLRQKIEEKHTRQLGNQEMQGTSSTLGVGRKKRKRNRKSQEKKGKRQRTNGLR